MSVAGEELFYPEFLEHVPILRGILDRVEIELVNEARLDGRTWVEIGAALDVTAQSAHRKHAARVRAERAAAANNPS